MKLTNSTLFVAAESTTSDSTAIPAGASVTSPFASPSLPNGVITELRVSSKSSTSTFISTKKTELTSALDLRFGHKLNAEIFSEEEALLYSPTADYERSSLTESPEILLDHLKSSVYKQFKFQTNTLQAQESEQDWQAHWLPHFQSLQKSHNSDKLRTTMSEAKFDLSKRMQQAAPQPQDITRRRSTTVDVIRPSEEESSGSRRNSDQDGRPIPGFGFGWG